MAHLHVSKSLMAYVLVSLVVLSLLQDASAKTIQIERGDRADFEHVLHRVKRVIGGSEVASGKWPWLVSLQGQIPVLTFFGFPVTRRNLYCGASLLNDRWLLTAAHCFVVSHLGESAKVPRYWHARLGDVNLSACLMDRLRGLVGEVLDVPEWKNWMVHADKVIIHPDYDAYNSWANDIALVRLEEPVPSGPDVPEIGSVTLTAQGERRFPADGQICIMKGWGCTQSGGAISHTAMEVPLPKINDYDCARLFGVDTRGRLCAGYNLAKKGICGGDSGSPLVCRQDNTWVQVGIASFTSSERPGDVPGAFTRVSAYTDWIVDMVTKHTEPLDLEAA